MRGKGSVIERHFCSIRSDFADDFSSESLILCPISLFISIFLGSILEETRIYLLRRTPWYDLFNISNKLQHMNTHLLVVHCLILCETGINQSTGPPWAYLGWEAPYESLLRPACLA